MTMQIRLHHPSLARNMKYGGTISFMETTMAKIFETDNYMNYKIKELTHFCLIVTMAAIKNLIATGGPDTASSPVMLTSAEKAYCFNKQI